MEGLLHYLMVAVGFIFFLLIFGRAALSFVCALFAYMRYHLLGIHSPIIEDLFYRSSRGETTPPPNLIKGLVPIFVAIGVFYFFFR